MPKLGSKAKNSIWKMEQSNMFYVNTLHVKWVIINFWNEYLLSSNTYTSIHCHSRAFWFSRISFNVSSNLLISSFFNFTTWFLIDRAKGYDAVRVLQVVKVNFKLYNPEKLKLLNFGEIFMAMRLMAQNVLKLWAS